MGAVQYLEKKTSDEMERSPWGLHFHSMREVADETMIGWIVQSGVKWTRLQAPWPRVETRKGHYNWGKVDCIVDAFASHGIRIFMGFGCSSHHAYQDFPEGYLYPPTRAPEALDGWTRYVTAAVERYRDRIRHFEIWNEPNGVVFWRPKADAHEYAQLVARSSAAIRSVDIDIKILGGVLSGVIDRLPYAREFMEGLRDFMPEREAASAFDYLCYHPYNPCPEVTFESIVEIREAVDELQPNARLWQGECGCPSSGDTIHFRSFDPWGYNIQAKWLLRRLLTDYKVGAEVSTYFLAAEFFGTLQPGCPELRTGFNTKGLVQHTTWAKKPAFYALQNLTALVDGDWTLSAEEAEIEVVSPGTLYGVGPHEDRFPCVPWQVVLRRGSTSMLAVWVPWRPQEFVKSGTVRTTLAGQSWNEPVVVDPLTGQVSPAVETGGAVELPLSDYPFFGPERSVLALANERQQPSHEEILSRLRWTY